VSDAVWCPASFVVPAGAVPLSYLRDHAAFDADEGIGEELTGVDVEHVAGRDRDDLGGGGAAGDAGAAQVETAQGERHVEDPHLPECTSGQGCPVTTSSLSCTDGMLRIGIDL